MPTVCEIKPFVYTGRGKEGGWAVEQVFQTLIYAGNHLGVVRGGVAMGGLVGELLGELRLVNYVWV